MVQKYSCKVKFTDYWGRTRVEQYDLEAVSRYQASKKLSNLLDNLCPATDKYMILSIMTEKELYKISVEQYLFKAKKVSNDEWVQGVWCGETWPSEPTVSMVIYNENPGDDIKLALVRTDTLCKYTGYTDAHNVRIFGNDILDHQGCKAVVVMEGIHPCVRYLGADTTDSLSYFIWDDNISKKPLVVGNIYDDRRDKRI